MDRKKSVPMCTRDSLPIGLLIYEKLSGLSSACEMIAF